MGKASKIKPTSTAAAQATSKQSTPAVQTASNMSSSKAGQTGSKQTPLTAAGRSAPKLNVGKVVAVAAAAASTPRLARRMDWWLKKNGGADTIPVKETKQKDNKSKKGSSDRNKTNLTVDNKLKLMSAENEGKPVAQNAVVDDTASADITEKPSKKRKRTQEDGKGEEKVKGPDKVAPKATNQKAYVIFVGNLPYDVVQEDLVKHFGSTGGLKAVRLLTNKETGKSRGCAYVEFDNALAHKFGLHLHESMLCGRKINVEFTSRGRNTPKRQERLKEKNFRAARFKRMRQEPE